MAHVISRPGMEPRADSHLLHYQGSPKDSCWFQWFCIFLFYISWFPYLYCFIHSTLGLFSFSRFLRQKLLSFSFFFPIQLLSRVRLCDPMDCSTPGLPVHHQLPEFTQTHVHWVGDEPTISSSVVPFSSRLQSFPASGSFPLSQFFAPRGQSIEVSASASVFPMNI